MAGALLTACGGPTSPDPTALATPVPGQSEPESISLTDLSNEAEATATQPAPTETGPEPTPADPASVDAEPQPTVTHPPPADPEPTATEPALAASIEPAFPGLPALKLPVALVDVPKHDLFLIALQDGVALAVPRDGPYDSPRTIYNQRERTLRYGYEEGLLALALDPGFDRNGYVYAYYSYSAGRGERSTRLVRLETTGEGDTFEFVDGSEFVILEIRQPEWNHNGGSLLFGPDGMLYLGVGDGGGDSDPGGNGQNPGTLLGSVIRIDVRNASAEEPYAIPPDNPMIGLAGARPEVWAYGLRNPWRMSFDRETGLLWAGDAGHYHAEEVDVIRPGENYGWSVTEGSSCFPQDETCDTMGLTLPVWEYGRSFGCAVIGGYVYRGEAIPSLAGWYVYADYCSRHVRAIHAETAASGQPTEAVSLFEDGPRFVFSMAEDASGEIYLLTGDEDSEASIYRLVQR